MEIPNIVEPGKTGFALIRDRIEEVEVLAVDITIGTPKRDWIDVDRGPTVVNLCYRVVNGSATGTNISKVFATREELIASL